MTEQKVHIFTRSSQPATRYVDTLYLPGNKTKRIWTRLPARSPVWAQCCRKRRWAKHCVVQVYYDMIPFYCAPGRGCRKEKKP